MGGTMIEQRKPRTIRLITAALLWVIFALFQLLLSEWTTKVAGQREVLDYISFAGTITSMLLAVLAIVYAYYTSASQKNDADRIAAQIASLGSTVSNLDRSEVRLSNELVRLGELRAALDEVGERVNLSHEQASRTREAVETMRQELEEKLRQQNPAAAELAAPAESFASSFPKKTTDHQCVTIFAAYMKHKLGLSSEDVPFLGIVEKYVTPFRVRKDELSKYLFFGEVFAYAMVLVDFGPVFEDFKRSFRERVSRLPQQDDEDYRWSILRPLMEQELAA